MNNYHNKLLAKVGEKFVEYIEKEEAKKQQLEDGELPSSSSCSSPRSVKLEKLEPRSRSGTPSRSQSPYRRGKNSYQNGYNRNSSSNRRMAIEVKNPERYKNPDVYKPLPKKFRTERLLPEDDEKFFCLLCRFSFRDSRRYVDHLSGYEHQMYEAKIIRILSNQTIFKCEPCGLTCQGQPSWDAHVEGAPHKKVKFV